MDEQRKQNNSIFNQIYSSKKAIQILLSLSLLAFVSSPYFSQLLSSLSSIQLLSTDRHYIFLLCNGIMLLVFKNSGLFATTSPLSYDHIIRKNVTLSHHQPTLFTENIHVRNNLLSHHQFTNTDFNNNFVKLQINDVLKTKEEINAAITNEVEAADRATTVMNQGGENVTSTGQSEAKEEVNRLFNLVDKHEHGQDEEEFVNIDEKEEQGIMIWSTEELNKKCDDFIKKMKYGIKFEAQLVMA